jgi:CheY-like chemotaxis protein
VRADATHAMEPTGRVATIVAPKADASELAAPETSGPEGVGGDDGRILRILVIEDDKGSALALRRLLSAYGHEVHLADSLATAEQIACAEGLDVLLSDLGLRNESGLEAPRRIADAARRCGRPAPPAIALTGFSRKTDIAQTCASGFVAHLVKPVSEQALLESLRLADAKR